jgi:signal transduction histidine kinase
MSLSSSFSLDFLEYLSDGVLVLNQHQQIVAANHVATRILGWSNQELVGEFCYKLLNCQHSFNGQALCQISCPNQPFWSEMVKPNDFNQKAITINHTELLLRCKNGELAEVSINFFPLSSNGNGKSGGITNSNELANLSILIMHDISELKRLERVKTQFLVTASHQLRTPLASIKTSIGLLLDNVPPDLAKPLVRLLQNIQSSSLQMERLVNDLIELASLQSGKIQLQNNLLEVQYLVTKAVEDKQNKLNQQGQFLEVTLPTTPVFVRGDSVRLIQVLGHLLANASKFSNTATTISLKVETAEVDKGTKNGQPKTMTEVIFSVSDQGRGISNEEQQLIFEKFYQSEVSENADGNGVGLGLPLARALIELHRGRLWLESTPGVGSTFYFALPMAQ